MATTADIGGLLLMNSPLILWIVVGVGCLAIIGLTAYFTMRNNNPYKMAFVPLLGWKLDPHVQIVKLFEVENIETKAIQTFRGNGLKGPKGLYISALDWCYDIPEKFYQKSVKETYLYFKRFGRKGILPLMTSYSTFNKAAVEKAVTLLEEYDIKRSDQLKAGVKEKDIEPFHLPEEISGKFVISGITDAEAVLLSDEYINSLFQRLTDVDSQTMSQFDQMMAKYAPSMVIVITGFLTLLLVGYFSTVILNTAISYCNAPPAPAPETNNPLTTFIK